MYFIILFLFSSILAMQLEISHSTTDQLSDNQHSPSFNQEGFEELEPLELSQIYQRENTVPVFKPRPLKRFRFISDLSTIIEIKNEIEVDTHAHDKTPLLHKASSEDKKIVGCWNFLKLFLFKRKRLR